jgi:hypothetical protein
MQNLFDTDTYNEITGRLNKLAPGTPGLWGKMNVSQMMAHCTQAFKVPLSDKPMPRMLMGKLIGWMVKPKLYNEKPWGKNLPTAPNFIIKDERDFTKEKQVLTDHINQFHSMGPTGVGKYPHPMFGKFTPEQWGMSMYKHLDHHLKQFGV